jgi:carboxymethylenebutenolidase
LGTAIVGAVLPRLRLGWAEEAVTVGEKVTFASNGGTADGYLAVPKSGTGPGVVVIQEWWGLLGHIESVCERFAAEGFIALAPDLYHGAATDEPDEAMRLMMGLAMDTAAKDIAGAARFLKGRPECSGKVGAVGFCMGGSLALWAAALSEDIGGAVAFYPAVPWERMNPQWANYDGKAAVIHCSEEDGTSAAEGIQFAKKAIEAAGGEVTVYDYPGTHHAFFNDDRPEVYDDDAARSAWARTLEVFRARLT